MPIGDKIHNIEINDSEFERIGWQNARYRGTKLTSAKINEYNRGDITFGLKPVIEQYSRTVYVFNQVENSFEALSGLFYPSTDEHFQSLPDKIIVGSAQFKIDRAVTFELDDPADNSQIQPGIDGNDPSFYYFDTLMKTDLAIFNSCSVKFFDNSNNGFVKPFYTVGYNQGEFTPAAAYFLSASQNTRLSASAGTDFFKYAPDVDNLSGSRFYINPNSEEWFIGNAEASGAAGTLGLGNVAITLDHIGSKSDINSIEGYFHNLSERLSKNGESYYISFDKGSGGSGSLNEKISLKAYDVHRLLFSGSGDEQNINTSTKTFKIQTNGRNNHPFIGNYINEKTEYILFKETRLNNVVHLDFNTTSEMPAGVGNGGVIIPNNLHPRIKERLNIYLSNAGLGAQGGVSSNFSLGSAQAREVAEPSSYISVKDLGFLYGKELVPDSLKEEVDTSDKTDEDETGDTTTGGNVNDLESKDIGEAPSDIRLKENIIYLRKSLSGIPIYKFNYIGKSTTYEGTMAQDLSKLGFNQAVIKNSNGYYSVNYNLIDINMRKV